jgi:hypothetical protein
MEVGRKRSRRSPSCAVRGRALRGQVTPQSFDGEAFIRKEKSSTLYRALPKDAGAGGTLPARIASKADTRRESTEGGATGMLWAPRTIRISGSSAASRLIETS